MNEQRKMTVTLSWRDEDGVATKQMGCTDQPPQDLIPKLLTKLELPGHDHAGDPIFYRLRLDVEQGRALRPKELLSTQNVYDGSRLWLVGERANVDALDKRCVLHLPDGTEIVVPQRGQGLRRTWLLKFVELHNAVEFERECQRLERRQSAYQYVANQRSHCTVSASDNGFWVVRTDRSDVVTEWAIDREFDRVPCNIPQQLHNGARLRLGGADGLEIAVILV